MPRRPLRLSNRWSSTANFLATATTARFLAFFPHRSASFSPQRHRSLSSTKGPKCVPPPRPQPEKTSDVTALLESMRIFDSQDISQGSALLLPSPVGEVRLLGSPSWRSVLSVDRIPFLYTLVERFDFSQQRLQGLPQLRA